MKSKRSINLAAAIATAMGLMLTAFSSSGLADSISFAVIGDYGSNYPAEGYVADLVTANSPHFVIATGDDYYNSAEGSGLEKYDISTGKYYCDFIDGAAGGSYCQGNFAETNAFFPSLGNHDYTDAGDDTASNYRAYFDLPGAGFINSSGNERYYDFVWGPVHFFVLNSNSQEPDGTSGTSTQAGWLQVQLAVSTSPWKVVYFHHAPYSTSGSHGDNEYMQWPFAQWGAHVVFSGHDHNYQRLEKDGIPYIVSGNGGKSLYTCGDVASAAVSHVCYDAGYGFVYVAASDTAMTITSFSIDDGANGANGGSVVDTYALPDSGNSVAASFQDGIAPDGAYAGTRDASIWQAHPADNYGIDAFLYVDGDDPSGSGDDLATLLRWDVSTIAPGVHVQSASIEFNIVNQSAHTYQVYAVNRDWAEDEVTWNEYRFNSSWDIPGAQATPSDRGETVLSALSAGSTGRKVITLNAEGAALVQSWVDTPSANHGIIITNSSATDGADFESREALTLLNRPKLTVHFEVISSDTDPPQPNPATWATPPYATGSAAIAMTASTATDATLPVSYLFDFVNSPTGGSGGTDSNWQSSVAYTNSGLGANHSYGYRVKARDSASPPNETGYSSPIVYKYTLANTPGAAVFSNVTQSSIRANWTANGNRAETQYYCENTTTGANLGWTVSTSWDSNGLTCGMPYSFRVKARNGDGAETDWLILGSQTTEFCSGALYVSQDGICAGNSICFTSIQAAIDAAANQATIKVREGNYEENILLDEPKEITLEGGYDPAFNNALSETTVSGSLTIAKGVLVPDKVVSILDDFRPISTPHKMQFSGFKKRDNFLIEPFKIFHEKAVPALGEDRQLSLRQQLFEDI